MNRMSRNPGFGSLPLARAPTANGAALKVRATPLGLRVSFFNPKSHGYATLAQARFTSPWADLGPSRWPLGLEHRNIDRGYPLRDLDRPDQSLWTPLVTRDVKIVIGVRQRLASVQ